MYSDDAVGRPVEHPDVKRMIAVKQVRRRRGSFMPRSIGRPPSSTSAVRVDLARHSHVVHLTAATPKQGKSRTVPGPKRSRSVWAIGGLPGGMARVATDIAPNVLVWGAIGGDLHGGRLVLGQPASVPLASASDRPSPTAALCVGDIACGALGMDPHHRVRPVTRSRQLLRYPKTRRAIRVARVAVRRWTPVLSADHFKTGRIDQGWFERI